MNISVTVRLFGPEPPRIFKEGYQDDRRKDYPGLGLTRRTGA
ncbi:MAG: hypothetical protein RQM90_00325 [Methanoculleus sp.]